MYNTRLSRLIMQAIERAGGQYHGILPLSNELDTPRSWIKDSIRRLQGAGLVTVQPPARPGPGQCVVITMVKHE